MEPAKCVEIECQNVPYAEKLWKEEYCYTKFVWIKYVARYLKIPFHYIEENYNNRAIQTVNKYFEFVMFQLFLK